MLLDKLIGKELPFYGVDGNAFKLGKTVYEAIEDPSDGYRSYLDSVVKKDPSGLNFFRRSIATVRVKPVDFDRGLRGYIFVDVDDGHEWLHVGTDHNDDYYPSFTFSYWPKPPKPPKKRKTAGQLDRDIKHALKKR